MGDLDWAGSTSQPQFSGSSEPCPQKLAVASPAPASHSSGENSLGTALPANWGVHILTLLSKNRDEPGENNSAASASGTASQAKAAQCQSQTVHQAQPDMASKQREKNKRAQKRHRDRQKAKVEENSVQIAVLAAELKRTQWEKRTVEQQAETLKTALAVWTGRSSQSAPQDQAGVNYEYGPSSGWIPQAVMKNTLQIDSPELMNAEQVKAMSIGDHQHLWRMLVFKLASLLPAVQGHLDSPAGVRLKDLMVEHSMRHACVAGCNFDRLHELMTSNMETGQPAEPITPDRWRSVAASAEFSDSQKRQLLLVRRHYYQQAGALASSRCRIAPWLQGQGALLGTYPGLANQFVTSHAAMRQMQQTMLQEQNLFISLLGAVWRRTCTTMQTAIMSVQSYPLAVDVVAVVNCLAEDAVEPSPGELMAGFTNSNLILDSSALRVPSPDLLLEVAHWNIDYPTHTA
ncbi:hypothetical protein WJX77_012326 [Trebouxia sp. C0004]